VALVGERRDAKLKVHLEEHASLVRFDAAAGSIDLFLLPGAPPQIANELREKLIAWTQRRWVVMLSKTAGERPIGEVRREREAAELESLKSHPAVKALLDEFPDARIEVRPLLAPRADATGSEETGTDATGSDETGTGG
jgi:DNA polymerase-3 subunit gamma/tau